MKKTAIALAVALLLPLCFSASASQLIDGAYADPDWSYEVSPSDPDTDFFKDSTWSDYDEPYYTAPNSVQVDPYDSNSY